MVCQFLAHCSIAVREMDNLKLFSYYEFVNTKIIPNLSRSVYLEKNLKFLVLKNNRENQIFFFLKKKRGSYREYGKQGRKCCYRQKVSID